MKHSRDWFRFSRARCSPIVAALVAAALILGGLTRPSARAFQDDEPQPGARATKSGRPPKAAKPPKTKEKPPKEEVKRTAKKDAEPEDDDSSDDSKKLGDLKKQQKFPRLAEMAVPTVAQLNQRPVDWLVLDSLNKGNPEVLAVKQVYPRPDTLQKMADELATLRKRPRPATTEEREKLDAQKADLQKLMIALPNDTAGQLYEIPTNKIDRIIYHEDLIIRRAGLLADQNRFRDALELLYPLERTVPRWKGLKEEARRMLLREARSSIQSGDYLGAWMSLTELRGRDRGYSGLQTALGDTTDKLIESARQSHDDRRARHFLGQLARIEPQHETVAKWNRFLHDETQNLINTALEAERGGHYAVAAEKIDRAAHIWPTVLGLTEAHRAICERYQRLSVGTMNLAGDSVGLPYSTLSDQRATRLSQFDLFEVDRVDDATHYRSRLLEQWEPTDLGRRAFFALRRTRARWESRPNLTAVSVMSTLRAFIDPASPAYDERFASYVDGVQLRSPLELEIRFSHAPPRLEPLFRFPIYAPGGSAAIGGASNGSAGHSGLGPVLTRRFELSRPSPDEAVFRRVYPQPDGLDQYQVAEVDERRYDSPQHEIQALMRGDISMLIDLPPWAFEPIRKDTHFFFLDYAIPTTHVLQLNPQSVPLKSRELRLALSYAVDAQRILSQRILRDPESKAGRLTTAPYATTSYAYNGLLPRREFSTGMAFGLHAAAVKRLTTIPRLKLLCERDPETQSAAEEIVAQWKRVGIDAELVSPPAATNSAKANAAATARAPLQWDLAYRKLRMEEPLTEIWSFLTLGAGARLETMRTVPDWLRLELLDLDGAPDWKSVVNRLQTLQGHLYAEVAYIPLFEVDNTIVLRKNVHDFPAYKFVNCYQDVERWIVQSWIPEDEP
jgi:ABC-type transport system substrate-binding protein